MIRWLTKVGSYPATKFKIKISQLYLAIGLLKLTPERRNGMICDINAKLDESHTFLENVHTHELILAFKIYHSPLNHDRSKNTSKFLNILGVSKELSRSVSILLSAIDLRREQPHTNVNILPRLFC
jgi:hypothetical protein